MNWINFFFYVIVLNSLTGTVAYLLCKLLALVAKKYNAKIAHIGSNANSSMTPYEDLFVRIPCSTKLDLPDEIKSNQVMSSLFEQSLLLLGDMIALLIVDKEGITDLHSLWRKHANLE